jgi:acyl dehydratase
MPQVDLTVIGRKTEPILFEYNWKDVALYALGVGATIEELSFVYENSPAGIKVLPSFCVVPAMRAYPHVGENIDFSRFLHGEHMIRLYGPLPPEGRILVVGEVKDIFDKGKGAVYHILVSGHTEEGEHLFDSYWVNFYVGAGGFGGSPGPRSEILNPPAGVDPDHEFTEIVAENQAALYRLNGDLNPLHLDPEFARGGGFDRPILHGLCTYGYAARAIVIGALGGDVDRLRSFKARFSNVVYPGDTLTTRFWSASESVIVEVFTERGVVLSNAVAEIT